MKLSLSLAFILGTTGGCWIVAGLEERPVMQDVTSDANEGGGGGGDATASTDAPAEVLPCLQRYPGSVFCDAFDTGAINPRWAPTNNSPFLITGSSAAFSKPHAMQVDAAGGANTTLVYFPPQVDGAVIAAHYFEARVFVAANSTARGSVAPIALELRADQWSAQLRIGPADVATVSCHQNVKELNGGAINFAPNAWHKVVLRIEANGLVGCDVDGITRAEPGVSGPRPGTRLRVGLETTDGQGPLSVVFDDIVYRTE